MPSPKYCSIASVTLFMCLTGTQHFKCSILSVICFFSQFTRYTLHVLRGTLAPSPHLRARQLERLPPSHREQRIREWRGISPSVRSREHCPSAWSTHTAQKLEFFNAQNCFQTETHIYVLHTWAPVYAGLMHRWWFRPGQGIIWKPCVLILP